MSDALGGGTTQLATGQIVRVRSRQYLVENVDPSPEPAHSTLVRLACLEDDARGEPLQVLWEREVDAQVIGTTTWDTVASRGFDDPRHFSAYLHTLRWNCVSSTNAALFQAPYRAGIEVKAYQLEPLRKALLMPRVNLFIADDVGLGKTIEAGLILRELLMRQKVRRTVISCPPSVVRQWQEEMEQRLADAARSRQAAAMLVVTSLQKRLLSSIEAFARTLHVHRDSMDRQAAKSIGDVDPDQLSLLRESAGADDERSDFSEAEVEAEENAQMAAASRQSAGPADAMAPEIELLAQMSEIAQRARYERDPRVDHLVEWIRQHLCPDLGTPGAPWLDRRVLIFTEYTDTKRYLEEQLEAAIAGSDRDRERILTFHGGIGEERREAIKAAFNTDPARHPLRILIATDAAREGVNLQNHCSDLFHFDVPWNPSRLEQRNGRIDRKLQRQREVYCRYFVMPQRAEDRVLDVLMTKTARIHEELGSLSPVVVRRLDRMLEHGIRHEQEPELTDAIETVDEKTHGRSGVHTRTTVVEEELEESRERHAQLETQLRRLQEMLKVSKDWIGLDDRHFRDALSASLEVLGAQGLEPLDPKDAVRDPSSARWTLPALHERIGADPTWAATLDTLRAPRKKGQKLWDWRREAPIRPVVFRDPGNLDGEVVHLHLEHRVVQRLLGRFLSQGFLHDELTRACVVRYRANRRGLVVGQARPADSPATAGRQAEPALCYVESRTEDPNETMTWLPPTSKRRFRVT